MFSIVHVRDPYIGVSFCGCEPRRYTDDVIKDSLICCCSLLQPESGCLVVLYKSYKSVCLSVWMHASSHALCFFFEDLCLQRCGTVRVIADTRTQLILDVSAVPDEFQTR